MKAEIHPDYHYVVFNDLASGEKHPFYTGKQRIMDSAGRVEKFKNRYAKFGKKN